MNGVEGGGLETDVFWVVGGLETDLFWVGGSFETRISGEQGGVWKLTVGRRRFE